MILKFWSLLIIRYLGFGAWDLSLFGINDLYPAEDHAVNCLPAAAGV